NGTVSFPIQQVNTDVVGTCIIEYFCLIELLHLKSTLFPYTTLFRSISVEVETGSRFQVDTNSLADFTLGSLLSVEGEVEIQNGGRLLLDGNNPTRDLTLLPGGTLSGGGLLALQGSCRLVILEDLDLR